MVQRLLGLTLAATTMLSVSALAAAPEHERVRGTVTLVTADTLTVHTATGDVPISLDSGTKVAEVEKSSLGKIEKGSYIGTATKTKGSRLIALEVVVFPPAMKGAGEGHYAWDEMPDTTEGGRATTGSTMTNGTVAEPTVSTMMTNGDVASATSHRGSKRLTVTYKGGEQIIVVPSTAPIVTFKPATVTDVTQGATVFVVATKDGDKVTANFVAVGTHGIKPPM
jgi:hypothetical protein